MRCDAGLSANFNNFAKRHNMFDGIFYTKLLDSFIQHYKRENRFIEFKSNYLGIVV